jgi:hypothetical protein
MLLGRNLVRLLFSLLPALVPAHAAGQATEKKAAAAAKTPQKKPEAANAAKTTGNKPNSAAKTPQKKPEAANAAKTTGNKPNSAAKPPEKKPGATTKSSKNTPAAAQAKKPSAANTSTKKKSASAPARTEAKSAKAAPGTRQRQEVGQRQAKTTQIAPKRPNPFLEVPAREVTEASPAYTYANLDNEAAYAELDRRGIPYQREEPGPNGVRAPIRLTGRLHGVEIHSTVPPEKRSTTHYEILDARLALALDDFCALLSEREIVELVHYTMYRPGASPRADSDSLPTRHPGGLAIDLGALRRKDGRWIDVREVWSADIGKKTCGAGAKQHEDDRARELVTLVCDAAERRLFHYMLTPHFDQAHHDHLHLEIKPAVKWFLVN